VREILRIARDFASAQKSIQVDASLRMGNRAGVFLKDQFDSYFGST
jgi:hypothetical protein